LPQDEPQNFVGEANSQHLIDTWRKRLCYMASPETRQYAEDFKKALKEVQPELSDVLVPNCIYRCGCPEMKGCGWFKQESDKHPKLKSTNIAERYEAYNLLMGEKK
jgi:thioredoxin-related protein